MAEYTGITRVAGGERDKALAAPPAKPEAKDEKADKPRQESPKK